MTTLIVPSISDEQLAELESHCRQMRRNGGAIAMSEEWLSGLIARLRAAEADAKRMDFIETHPNWLRYSKGRYSCVLPHTNYPYSIFATARQAIDAAMGEAG